MKHPLLSREYSNISERTSFWTPAYIQNLDFGGNRG